MKFNTTLVLMFFVLTIFAQKSYITSMKVLQQGDYLIIEYDLERHQLQEYHYLIDFEFSYEGGIINPTPELITGDYSGFENKAIRVGSSGSKNKIIWNILQEPVVTDITGEISVNLKARLFAKLPAGPESALYSVLVPGLGQKRVRDKKFPFYLITTAAYGSVATGFLYQVKSNNSANTYTNFDCSSDQAECSRLFDKFKKEEKLGYAFLAIGGGIWLTDIVLTAIKGGKNKKEYQKYYSAHQPFNLKMDYSQIASVYCLGIQYSF